MLILQENIEDQLVQTNRLFSCHQPSLHIVTHLRHPIHTNRYMLVDTSLYCFLATSKLARGNWTDPYNTQIARNANHAYNPKHLCVIRPTIASN